jgi:putative Mg2+ transporter-C (MgtC) family protein
MPYGESWVQFGELLLALLLSSLIGTERELRQKSAGLRTHALVGVGTALFVEVSKYGFHDVMPPGSAGYDPSRIAAQIVSGIGFIGGGLIFVRRDAVRGLTTAAVVWLTCAVGMACGAGLPLLAIGVTLTHFLVVYGYTPILRRLSGPPARAVEIRLTYLPSYGVLPSTLVYAIDAGFQVVDVSVHHRDHETDADSEDGRAILELEDELPAQVTSVVLKLEGPRDPHHLVAELSELKGVVAVGGGRVTEPDE